MESSADEKKWFLELADALRFINSGRRREANRGRKSSEFWIFTFSFDNKRGYLLGREVSIRKKSKLAKRRKKKVMSNNLKLQFLQF